MISLVVRVFWRLSLAKIILKIFAARVIEQGTAFMHREKENGEVRRKKCAKGY